MQAELVRVDLLLRRCALRQEQADAEIGAPEYAATGALVPSGWPVPTRYAWHAPPGSVSAPEPEWADAYAAAVQQSTDTARQAQRAGRPPRLQQVATAFGLDAFELDIFLLALLPALDPTIGRFYAYLQDDATLTYPTVQLALEVLCDVADLSRLTRSTHFAPGAPLIHHGLLILGSEAQALPRPLLSQGLGVDPAVVTWLLGEYQPHNALGKHARLAPPQKEASDELLATPSWPQLATLEQGPAIFAFYGPDVASQAATARLFAGHRNRSLLTVNLPALINTGVAPTPSPTTVLHFALRDARLTGAIVYLTGLDVCLEQGSLPPVLWKILAEHADTVITSSHHHWRTDEESPAYPLVGQAFPMPEYAQRRLLWTYYLNGGAGPKEPASDEVDVAALAGQFALDSGRIRAVVAAARLAAQQRGDLRLRDEDLFAAARDHSSTRLGDLAHKLRPRQIWADLVLPAEKIVQLQEVVAMVRGRPKVLDEWGLAKKLAPSRAVTTLFAGEPGTGKTMAAEVIANDLGLDLYKIDLSSLIDKYIGETEKNLERIFLAAESANAILFFDEADAIFGKRTGVKDAHDRYANVGVSYLLQRMESFDGVTILATNLRANLDDAFTRRLHFVIDFPFPDAAERLRIWQTLFSPDLPRSADVDLEWMAQRFKLAGGGIRNIIVSAAYLAAAGGEAVAMSHLLHGARRELQKMGRLSVGDMEEYTRQIEAQKTQQQDGVLDKDPNKSISVGSSGTVV